MVTSNPDTREQLARRLRLSWDFIRHLNRRYNQDGCRESAAALTYVSLFAVVPLLTLVYSVFSMIPAFGVFEEQVNDLIFNNFIPEAGAEIQQYLVEFSGKARTLSAVGVLILIVTSYLMLANIEKTFNKMWGAVGNRRGLSGFLLYWGILSFGPLLVGVGLLMHTYLVSFKVVMENVDLGLTALLLEYLPWLLTWVAFTLLFIAVPNCRVNHRFAMIGGAVATVLFQMAKGLFGAIVANSSFHTVYGAFAILPLFLMWIYLCWMITLSSAELVRSLETFASSKGFRLPGLTATVLICYLCWEYQQKGRTVTERDIRAAGVEQQHWLKLREMLLKYRFIEVTRSNHYVFTRDIEKVTLWQLVAMFGENFTKAPTTSAKRRLGDLPWIDRLDELVHKSAEQSRELFSVTLGELFVGGEAKQ